MYLQENMHLYIVFIPFIYQSLIVNFEYFEVLLQEADKGIKSM